MTGPDVRRPLADGTAGTGSSRRPQSLPAWEPPGGRGLNDALRLGRWTRLRLLAAVRALLADDSLAGLRDAPRLAAVVLYAKSRAREGRENDLQSSIWGAELGRWLGVRETTVHHDVLPPLRASGALRTRVVTNAKGHPTGLDCLVMPLWKARGDGGAAHPLALSKAELATLLRLCEALFGPGWTPEGKKPTPPGLLAGRTGRGAATDRLGLLLMVLNTPASGRLQLCGGSVRKKEGRGAATLARLLGCSPSGARKVLARLAEAGVVARQHKETATRMRGRGRVMLLPVARAYGRVPVPAEAAQSSWTGSSRRPAGALGDHAPAAAAGAVGTPGVSGAEAAIGEGDRERPAGTELHTVHTGVVAPAVPPWLSCGFSGEGRESEGCRPERACVREDQAEGGEEAGPPGRCAAAGREPAAEAVPQVAGVPPARVGPQEGPLRGEKPTEHPPDEVGGPDRPPTGRARLTITDPGRQPTRRRRGPTHPHDLRLQVALAPVADLWKKLDHSRQTVVQRAAERALGTLSGLVDPGSAPQLLADRLADRLVEADGEAGVREPVSWLLGRGLVQRQMCGDRRCDDGIRLDTGGDCPGCTAKVAERRAVRARIRAETDARIPDAGAAVRQAAFEKGLRQRTAFEAGLARARQTRAADEVEVRRAAVARRREAEESAELRRRAAACGECGTPGAAGLCPRCTYRRRAEALAQEAVDLVVAVRADFDDAAQVAALTLRCRADTRALLAEACRRSSHGDEALAAFTAPQIARRIRDGRRASALRGLFVGAEAEAEAAAVYDTVLRRWPHGHRAAEEAAEEARSRTAHYLLERRLGQLRVLRVRMEAGRVPLRQARLRSRTGGAAVLAPPGET